MSNQGLAMFLVLTENCNLACKYCYEESQRNNMCAPMTLETAKQSIDYLINRAKQENKEEVEVVYFGGEPLLSFDIIRQTFDYGLQQGKSNNIRVRYKIITNCTLYPDGYEEFLCHWFESEGYVNVQLSIDGIPSTHDANRVFINGKGSSQLVETTLDKYLDFAKRKGVKLGEGISPHQVVTKDTLPRLYDSYMYFADKGFLSHTHMLVETENWTDLDVEIYRRELRKLSQFVIDNFENVNTRFNVDILNKYRRRSLNPCSAGKDGFGVAPDGSLYPCHNFYFNDKSTKFGDVFDGHDDSKRKVFLDYDINNLIGVNRCAECENEACYICVAQNHTSNGNMFVGFPKYCKMSLVESEIRKELKKRLETLGLLKDETTKGCITVDDENTLRKIMEPLAKVLENHLENDAQNITAIKEKLAQMDEKMLIMFDVLSRLAQIIISDKEGGK